MSGSAPYQLLPALSEAEYAALRESIAEHGIRVPIEVDEDGNILDGHHRAAIAEELGIDCPQVVVSNLDTETSKRTVALMLNLSRRHLTREQKRQVIAASIEADPHLSDREHARRCGASPTTVGTVRRSMSSVSKLDSDIEDQKVDRRVRVDAADPAAAIDKVIEHFGDDAFIWMLDRITAHFSVDHLDAMVKIYRAMPDTEDPGAVLTWISDTYGDDAADNIARSVLAKGGAR